MTLNDFVTEVAVRAGKDLNQVVNNNLTLKQWLVIAFNLVHKNFNALHKWPWRQKTFNLPTTANYTTGTVSVTIDSRTVTGAGGASFSSGMVGRFLKLNREAAMYEILAVPDSSTLTLDQPYLGTTGSGLEYIIYRRYYELPPDCPFSSDIILWSWPKKPSPVSFERFDETFRFSHLTQYPVIAFSSYGINRRLTTYSDGTISLTEGSRTLTGTSTLFLDNAFPGSRIIVGANTYNVESVDSNTQITMVQNSLSNVSNSTYSIRTRNRVQIILSNVPSPRENLYVTYYKRTFDLVHDNDEPEVYEEYHIALSNILYAYMLEKLTNERGFAWLQVATAQSKQVIQMLDEGSPIDQAPLISRSRISGYRPGLYA